MTTTPQAPHISRLYQVLRQLPKTLKTEIAKQFEQKFKTSGYKMSLSRQTFGESERYFLVNYLVENNLVSAESLQEQELLPPAIIEAPKPKKFHGEPFISFTRPQWLAFITASNNGRQAPVLTDEQANELFDKISNAT